MFLSSYGNQATFSVSTDVACRVASKVFKIEGGVVRF